MTWKPLNITDQEIKIANRLFNKKAKFIIDESIDKEVIVYLKEKGWNTKSVLEVGLQGHSDEDINSYSIKSKRIILTHDEDFLNDRRFQFHNIYGIIVLPGGSGDLRALGRALEGALFIVGPYVKAY